MRKLRIKNNQQNVRSLPPSHPLFDHFEKTKLVAKKARTSPIQQRPKLVKQLHRILKEFWTEEKKKEPQLPSFSKTLGEVKPELKTDLTAGDAEQILQTLKQTGSFESITGEYNKTVVLVKAEEQREEQKKIQQAIKLIESVGGGHSDESEEIQETDSFLIQSKFMS